MSLSLFALMMTAPAAVAAPAEPVDCADAAPAAIAGRASAATVRISLWNSMQDSPAAIWVAKQPACQFGTWVLRSA